VLCCVVLCCVVLCCVVLCKKSKFTTGIKCEKFSQLEYFLAKITLGGWKDYVIITVNSSMNAAISENSPKNNSCTPCVPMFTNASKPK